MKVGLPTILFVLFLTLKLTGHIAWPWIWVAAPLWAPLCIVGLMLMFVFVVSLITSRGR